MVRATAWCAASLLLVVGILASVPGEAQTAVKSIAVVDFPVRGRFEPTGESVWLGLAISELLQAKLQLLGGARVLERLRIRALVHETEVGKTEVGDTRIGEAVASTDLAALARVVPADVLIAGSVGVDPKDPRRIRVQARAFEVETSKVVSEAVFSGMGDLGGLLKITTDLAQTLADGLKLASTPEQLAYAEPAKIETLRFFVEGERHLAAGRHREAITAFQKALDGNEGRYYAAAHRLQGEAYQALAREQGVREEYLKKFKDDALAASGALYDLGLAYEANGMWTEAVGAFSDYISAVGAEGERVLWRIDTRKLLEPKFPPGAQGARQPSLGRIVIEREHRVHFVVSYGYRLGGREFVTDPALVTLDARTGEVVRHLPFSAVIVGAAGVQPGPGGAIGISEGSSLLLWGRAGARHIVAAVDPAGEVLWRHDLGPLLSWSESDARIVGKGLLVCRFHDKTTEVIATLDVKDGTLRSRLVLSEGGRNLVGQWDLDPVASRLRVSAGSYALEDGTFTPRSGPDGAAFDPREEPRETGIPGLSYTGGEKGTRLYRDGVEALSVERFRTSWRSRFPLREGEPILLEWPAKNRFAVVDTRHLSLTDLYRGYAGHVRLEAQSPGLLLFRLERAPGDQNPRYTLPLAGAGQLYTLLDAVTGEVAAKFTWPDAGIFEFLGQDLLVQTRELVRLRVPTRRDIVVTPIPEARLRIAHCLFSQGDAAGAEKELVALEGVLPGEPRIGLLRLRLAVRNGAAAEAAGHALRSLASGGLNAVEFTEAMAAVRAARPEVREAFQTPMRANLRLRAIVEPGIIVCTPADSCGSHLLVDTVGKSTAVLRTPEPIPVDGGPSLHATVYRGRHLYGFAPQTASPEGAANQDYRDGTVIVRVDLLNGSRVRSSPFPRWCRPAGFLPGVGVVAQLSCGTSGGELWRVDPESLALERVSGTTGELFLGPEAAVVIASAGATEAGEAAYVALDRKSGAPLREGTLQLRDERIVDATVDREGLVFAIAGGRLGTAGGEARSWIRISSVPLAAGGPLWDYSLDGVVGGNIVIEGERVSFPAFEGALPARRAGDDNGAVELRIAPESLPLRRVSLDRGSGARLGAGALPLFPWNTARMLRPVPIMVRTAANLTQPRWLRDGFQPPGPRRILPGSAESVVARGGAANFPLLEYWLPAPGRHPVGVEPGSPGGLGRILVRFSDRNHNWFEGGAMLVAGDTVYESLGGGVLLVKDFAGGAGLDRLLGPPMENDPRDAAKWHP